MVRVWVRFAMTMNNFVYLQIASCVVVVVVCVHYEGGRGPTELVKRVNYRRSVRRVNHRCLFGVYLCM